MKKLLLFTTLVALIYYSWDLNAWRFAYVGDEWPFYTFARMIVLKNFLLNPFSFAGVFEQNSILSSMYQALFLKLFGFSNSAWRLSNIILIIPITIFCYKWVKQLFGGTVALYSTLFLQISFYLANFLKIGKNMPQALTLFLLCLLLATNVAKNPSKKNFFLLGMFLGISFYIYIGPLFPLIIWPLLLPLLPSLRGAKSSVIAIRLAGEAISTRLPQPLHGFAMTLLGYFLLLLPLFFQTASLTGPAGKTLLHREFTDQWQILINILHNFLLFYANYDYLYNHFIAGPYLDPFTGTLACIGTIVAIVHRKKPNYLSLLLVYICACVVIGITSPYPYTPATRGLFILPFGMIFAGIGLAYFTEKWTNKVFIGIFFLLIFGVNYYQSQIGVFKQNGYSASSLLVKELQEANAKHAKLILLLSDTNRYYGYNFVPAFQEAYDLKYVDFEAVRTSKLNCSLLNDTTLLVLQSDIQPLNEINKLHCPRTKYSLKVLSPTIPL